MVQFKKCPEVSGRFLIKNIMEHFLVKFFQKLDKQALMCYNNSC